MKSTILSSNNSGSPGNVNRKGYSAQISQPNTMFDDVSDKSTSNIFSKLQKVEEDLKRRQESYIARERGYKARISELEDEISSLKSNKTSWMKSNNKIVALKHIQSEILNNIDLVQDRTAKILQEQERDFLKAFRARLYDVQTELDKEKSKRDDGASAWIDRCNVLTSELEWSKGVADRLERINQSLLKENNRLKDQSVSQEEDRNYIISQLVIVKKDNAKLRTEYNALELELTSFRNKAEADERLQFSYHKSNTSLANLVGLKPAAANNIGNEESDEKFKEINVRLKRLLVEERKSLQQLRQTYANELKSRTDLELLLRQCVDDVRKEIARKKLESGIMSNNSMTADLSKLYNRQPGLIPIEEFTREDRERTLELLLSQERVVTMLYAKTFPVKTAITTSSFTNLQGNGFDVNSFTSASNSNALVNILDSSDSNRPASVQQVKTPTDREKESVQKLPLLNNNASRPVSSNM